MTERTLLNQRQVAARIARSYDWLSRHKEELVDEHGFPHPVAGPGKPRWDPAAIDAWLDAQMPAKIVYTEAATDWSADLDRRSAEFCGDDPAAPAAPAPGRTP